MRMRSPISLRAALAVSVFAGATLAIPRGARAQGAVASDSAAVLAVVERLFGAMSRRDTMAARALLLPGSRLTSMRADTLGGSAALRTQSDVELLIGLATGRDTLRERMWSPVVRVHGALADVWAPYDFHVNGKRTHCGVDVFSIVRSAAGWQIAGITYTVEPTGCPESPLGPLR